MITTQEATTIRHLSRRTLVVSGMVVSSLIVGWTNRAVAQLRPIADDTLGSETSRVVPLDPAVPVDRIEGGAQRGSNLFHSFREFHVEAGRGVYFADPGVANIVGRVTGGIESQILGVLGVVGGTANLFLINPSGIIFGPNARLDVRGSFLATTAGAVQFGEQGFFSATNPTAPPLLTVQPSAFLFNQLNPAPIVSESRNVAAVGPTGQPEFGLRVLAGQNLTLLGGNVSLNRGGMSALGGRVEIGGLSQPGTVALNADGSLEFPVGVARSDVTVSARSRIDVAGNGGGSITVNARNFEILDSALLAGIGNNSGLVGAQAGDITLNADAIRAGNRGIITNRVGLNGIGNGGNIQITTGSLSLTNSSQLQAVTLGQGNAGNVIIEARDSIFLNESGIFSSAGIEQVNVVGNGGDIRITTGSLSLTNQSILTAATFGAGNAGNVIIDARDRVDLDNGSIRSSVDAENSTVPAVGSGGDIRITTGSLSLTNGSQLVATTAGQGDAGNVVINARDYVSLVEQNFPISGAGSAIFSSVGFRNSTVPAVGNGSDIRITTGSLFLSRGQLIATTSGQGNAGNVIIDARDLISLDKSGSAIASSVVSPNSTVPAVGNGGNIRITTGSLSLKNGAQLLANTFGQGNAGNVIIDARDRVSLDGVDPTNLTRSSAIVSSAGFRGANVLAIGNGGDIRITTGSLSVTNGGQLIASTFTQGNAGNVIIDARDRVSLDGANSINPNASSAILSSVGFSDSDENAVGNGGDIRITTGSLSVINGSQLIASTFEQGNAGNIMINARDRVALAGVNQQGIPSGILTTTQATAQGRGGDVNIGADSIRLTDEAFISAETENRFPGGTVTLNANTFEAIEGGKVVTTTSGSGQAGDIILDVGDRITLSGVSSNNSSTNDQGNTSGLFANTARNSSGPGGTIQITTGQLQVFDQARVAVNSQGSGIAGNIDITADTVRLTNQSQLTAETTAVNGGNINLRDVGLVLLRNGSLISTTAGTDRAGGNGGNINIDADFIVAVLTENSDIRANAFTGSGGNVRITTQGLFGITPRPQDNPLTSDITASSALGLQGTVNIAQPDVDPSRGLTELPASVIDAANQITQTCPSVRARKETGEFVVKGQGGLPPSPINPLAGDESLADWATLDQPRETKTVTTALLKRELDTVAPIVEAQEWVISEDGSVNLVAAAPANSVQPPCSMPMTQNK